MPKWCTPREIILVKRQLVVTVILFELLMAIMIYSPVSNSSNHPLFINFSYKFRIQKIDISMIHINNWFYQDFFWKLHNRTHSTIDFFKERSPQQIDIRKKLIDLIGHVLYLLPTLFSKCCACKLIRIQEVGIRPSG